MTRRVCPTPADSATLGHTLMVPEGLEVEIYRRAALSLVGRRIERIDVDERIAGPGVVDAVAVSDGPLVGQHVTAARRVGKLLLLEIGSGDHVLGLHFGMTGRIVVDGCAPIDRLEYGARRDDPAWDRLWIELDGGSLRLNDPRRWARVTLDPDTSRLGPDLLAVGVEQLERALFGRTRALKSALLDQAVIAGLGNMCVDEVLWHAALAPTRSAGSLLDTEVVALHRAMVDRLPAMLELGGSHRGVISPEVRSALPTCPLDGAPLRRRVVAGRTTIWCDVHQT